jgi:hypothetical protein
MTMLHALQNDPVLTAATRCPARKIGQKFRTRFNASDQQLRGMTDLAFLGVLIAQK